MEIFSGYVDKKVRSTGEGTYLGRENIGMRAIEALSHDTKQVQFKIKRFTPVSCLSLLSHRLRTTHEVGATNSSWLYHVKIMVGILSCSER